MEKRQTAFVKQSIIATKSWDDFQLLMRRSRMLLGNSRPKALAGKR